MANKVQLQDQRILRLLTSIPEFEKKLKAGRKVIRLLEKYTSTIDKTEKKLSRGDIGLNTQLQQATSLKDKIQQVYQVASQQLTEVNQIVSNLKIDKENLSQSIQEAHQTIAEVNDSTNGISAQLTKANSDKDEVRQILLSVEENRDYITAKLESIEEKIGEMNTLYTSFLDTKTLIDDPEKGLVQVLKNCGLNSDEIIAIKKKSDILYTDIKKTRDDAVVFLSDITKIKEEAELSKDNIVAFAQESEENNTKIAEIYGIATGRSLSGSFAGRKKELQWLVAFWGTVLVAGVGLYIGLLIWIYNEAFKNGTPHIDEVAWYRLTITLPVLFLIGFASYQYSRERNLLEKYAFKSATSLALEAYMKLLTDKFSQFEEEIVKFVLNAMTMIYKEPHEKEKSYKFNVGVNKIFNVAVEEKEQAELGELFAKTVDTTKIENIKKAPSSIKPVGKIQA